MFWKSLLETEEAGKALWGAGNSMLRAPRRDQQAMWPGLRGDLGLSL